MPSAAAATRDYIAAEEVQWDYLPGGNSLCRSEMVVSYLNILRLGA